MARDRGIAIVGGGLGGLTVGILLERAGYRVTVYEQADRLARLGAGITIFPNGMQVLRAAGVADELIATGVLPKTLYSREWDTGRLLYSLPSEHWHSQYGEPHIILHRGDLQAALAKQLKPGTLVFQKQLVSIDEIGDALEARFTDGTSAEADVIIGADGINSRVRELLLGPEAPQYTGYVAYRSIFSLSRLNRPLESDWCKFWSDERHWSKEARHFIIYYTTKAKDEVYFVTSSPDPSWEVTLPVPVTLKEVKDVYAGFHNEVQRVIDASVEVTKWPLLVRDPLPLWSSGRVALLGDACHPMKPYMGQGAGMAFEDAAVLLRSIRAKNGDYMAAFRLYESNRHERTSKVQRTSSENNWLKYEDDPTWCFGYNANTIPLHPIAQAQRNP